MGQAIKSNEWAKTDSSVGCPKCGGLSFIRLRNKNGEVMGNSVVCADCKSPYTLDTGEDKDGS